MARRAMGALEDEVMSYVWSAGTAVTPGEVRDAVGRDLAYTTVMTILTRLWKKGLLVRERRGRAFAYSAVETEAQRKAGELRDVLDRAADREAVLNAFVGSMSEGEEALLRRVLDEGD